MTKQKKYLVFGMMRFLYCFRSEDSQEACGTRFDIRFMADSSFHEDDGWTRKSHTHEHINATDSTKTLFGEFESKKVCTVFKIGFEDEDR